MVNSHQFTVNNDLQTQRLTVHSIYIAPVHASKKTNKKKTWTSESILNNTILQEPTITIT